jgi:hypothetical protein
MLQLCYHSNKPQLCVSSEYNHMTKHWSDFRSVNPSNSHSLNLVTLPLNPTVTSYNNSARSAARFTAEARKYW